MNYKSFLTTAILVVLVFTVHSQQQQQQQQLNLYYPLQQGKSIQFQLPKLFNSKQLVMVTPLISEQKINHHICFPITKVKASFQQLSSISRSNSTQEHSKQGYQVQYDMQKLFTMGNHLDSVFVQDWKKLFILTKDQSLQIYSIVDKPSSIKLLKTIKFQQQLQNSMLISGRFKNQSKLLLISQNKLFKIQNTGQIQTQISMTQINGFSFSPLQGLIVDAQLHQSTIYLTTSSELHLYKLTQKQNNKIEIEIESHLTYKINININVSEDDLISSIEQMTVDLANNLLHIADNQYGIITLNMNDLKQSTTKNSIKGYIVYDSSSSNCHSLTLTVYKNNLLFLCPNLITISTKKITQCISSTTTISCSNNNIKQMVLNTMSLGYYGKKILVNESQIVIVGHKKYEFLIPILDNKTNQITLMLRGHQVDYSQNQIIQNYFINKNSSIILTQKKISSIVSVQEKVVISCKTKKSEILSAVTGKLTGTIIISGSCSDIATNYNIVNYKVKQKNICEKDITLTIQVSAPTQELQTIQQILIGVIIAVVILILVYFGVKGVKLMLRMKQYKNLIQQKEENNQNKSKRIKTQENIEHKIHQKYHQ